MLGRLDFERGPLQGLLDQGIVRCFALWRGCKRTDAQTTTLEKATAKSAQPAARPGRWEQLRTAVSGIDSLDIALECGPRAGWVIVEC